MDINIVRSKKAILQTELANYLTNPVAYQKEITATRGRLLRILQQEYKLEPDPNIKNSIMNEINTQSRLHTNQLNNRISKNKNDNKSMVRQIPNEVALKFRKLSTNIKAIKNSKNVGEGLINSTKAVGNTISMVGSIAKVPLVGTIKLGGKVAPTVGKILVSPLNIPAVLFSKIINPDSKYNGRIINSMGNFLGKEVTEVLKLVEQGVKKI